MTARSGITQGLYGMGACAADYDNDGWIDLYVTNVGPNLLYHNNGGKTFTDVTRTAGVGSRSFGTSCAFADVDRDGYVDLFVTNYVDARADNNIFCGDTGQSTPRLLSPAQLCSPGLGPLSQQRQRHLH